MHDDPSMHDIPRPNELREKGEIVHEVTIEPNYEVTAEWFARALREHSFQKNAKEPVISLIEQIRYLVLTDPDAVKRILARLAK